jgi:hypothetical protein
VNSVALLDRLAPPGIERYSAPIVRLADDELEDQQGWVIFLGIVAAAVIAGYAVLCTLQRGSFYVNVSWSGVTVACYF